MEEPHLGEHNMAGDELDVACVLCQGIMFTSPVSLQCGHYFCWECVHVSYRRSMKTILNCYRQAYTENLSEAKECPTCRDIMISCHTVYPPGPQGVQNPETPSRPERGEVRLIGQVQGRSRWYPLQVVKRTVIEFFRSPSPHVTPPPSPQQDALGAAQNRIRAEVFDFIGEPSYFFQGLPIHVNYAGDGLDDGDDLLDRENGAQEEEGGGGENGRGGGGVPAQRRSRKFWDGSQVPGTNMTHKQVIASFTRRYMEEEEVSCSSLFRKWY